MKILEIFEIADFVGLDLSAKSLSEAVNTKAVAY